MKLRTRTAALFAVPALALGLAACSNDDATVVTSAPVTDKAADAVTGDDTATTTATDGGTTTATGAPLGQDPATVQVGGHDVEGEFAPVRCEVDDRDLDVEAGPDESRGQVDIEIEDYQGTPRLEGLDIDTANLHVEVDDRDAEGATVTRDGDVWTIEGQGHHDDDENRVEQVRVEVVCPV
ncbi:lipoprotein LpqH [Corynebacterium sp. 335C]